MARGPTEKNGPGLRGNREDPRWNRDYPTLAAGGRVRPQHVEESTLISNWTLDHVKHPKDPVSD